MTVIPFFLSESCVCNGLFPGDLQAVGDNAQGFANFIIFCLFTERIRVKVKRGFRTLCSHGDEEIVVQGSGLRGPHGNQLQNSGSHPSPYLRRERAHEQTALLAENVEARHETR